MPHNRCSLGDYFFIVLRFFQASFFLKFLRKKEKRTNPANTVDSKKITFKLVWYPIRTELSFFKFTGSILPTLSQYNYSVSWREQDFVYFLYFRPRNSLRLLDGQWVHLFSAHEVRTDFTKPLRYDCIAWYRAENTIFKKVFSVFSKKKMLFVHIRSSQKELIISNMHHLDR